MTEGFMGTAMDCEHDWQDLKMTEPGPFNLPPRPFDECGDCGMKVWSGAIDALPVKGIGWPT